MFRIINYELYEQKHNLQEQLKCKKKYLANTYKQITIKEMKDNKIWVYIIPEYESILVTTNRNSTDWYFNQLSETNTLKIMKNRSNFYRN